MSSPALSISAPVVTAGFDPLDYPAIGTPPEMSPFASGPPPRCGPTGVDPFAETRREARAAAEAGCLCPVNQHGCMYFSASEWRFCNMCEWQTGHGMGEHSGALASLGGPIAEHNADIAAGRVVFVSRTEINIIFSAPATRSFMGSLNDWTWQRLGGAAAADAKIKLTRAQLHNLLMEYGSPSSCLTDELWLELQARYPPPPPAGGAAAGGAPSS
jgi:hypothetical protein